MDKAFEKFNLPILEIDEYKLFKELFDNLKQSDPENMKQIINSLSDEDKKELKQILSTCYVPTNQTLSQTRRILKVKYSS